MKDESFSAAYKAAPRWQQKLIQILLVLGFFAVAASAIEFGQTALFGSAEARAIKGKLNPIADQLEQAQKVGDQGAVLALMEPATKLIEDYNGLDEARKEEMNNSSIRYCLLATIHLSDGVSEVLSTGYWLKKDQYENALAKCM